MKQTIDMGRNVKKDKLMFSKLVYMYGNFLDQQSIDSQVLWLLTTWASSFPID